MTTGWTTSVRIGAGPDADVLPAASAGDTNLIGRCPNGPARGTAVCRIRQSCSCKTFRRHLYQFLDERGRATLVTTSAIKQLNVIGMDPSDEVKNLEAANALVRIRYEPHFLCYLHEIQISHDADFSYASYDSQEMLLSYRAKFPGAATNGHSAGHGGWQKLHRYRGWLTDLQASVILGGVQKFADLV